MLAGATEALGEVGGLVEPFVNPTPYKGRVTVMTVKGKVGRLVKMLERGARRPELGFDESIKDGIESLGGMFESVDPFLVKFNIPYVMNTLNSLNQESLTSFDSTLD